VIVRNLVSTWLNPSADRTIAWTIGYDERYGSNVRLQQALMYYRPNVDDSQYAYPLDFCPIFNADTQEV